MARSPMRSAARSPAQSLKTGQALTLSGVTDGAEGLIFADLARTVAARADAPALAGK
jgi:transcription-repair coupling factor (superfamily II helicase)